MAEAVSLMHYDVTVENRQGQQYVIRVFTSHGPRQAKARARDSARDQSGDRTWRAVSAAPVEFRSMPGRRLR